MASSVVPAASSCLPAEISASEAERIGLVNAVFDEASFASEVENYVSAFATLSKSAVALSKTLLYQIDSMPFLEALESGVDVNVIARMTDDCQKGIARFLARDQDPSRSPKT